MKSTGIVRKIDELGRIVIPKELRTTLNIHTKDSLEIFVTDDGGIVLMKINLVENIHKDLDQLKEIIKYEESINNKEKIIELLLKIEDLID